jgi:hypothetical protein
MRLAPLVKALLVVGLAFSVAGALVTHQSVGAVEWLVGVAVVAALSASALHFVRQSLRAT